MVVDEVSMLDVLLANQLAKAIASGTHLLLAGDPDQLPSVGAGNVLSDLLQSDQFPVTRLTQRVPPRGQFRRCPQCAVHQCR
jgi:exodeoxyribonuclease V alpha subunit